MNYRNKADVEASWSGPHPSLLDEPKEGTKPIASSRGLLLADTTILASLAILVAVWVLLPKDPFGGVAAYLPFHMVVETLSIVVSLMIFGVTWNARSQERASGVIVLSCAMLAVGLVDFGHMLSVSGMPAFVTPSSPQKGISFWLAARSIAAAGFLAAALLPLSPLRRSAYRYAVLTLFVAATALTYWLALYHLDALPVFFVPGKGLTTTKVNTEWIIIAIQLIAAFAFSWRARRTRSSIDIGMYAAVWLSVLSEAYFTFYAAAHDLFQVLGHVYKIIAFGFLYRAVFVACVREPFTRLVETQADLQLEVDARRRAETEIRALNAMLEDRVRERTMQLEATNKELEAFSYSVSHDLRAPLRAIDGFSRKLVSNYSGKLDEEAQRQLQVVRDNAQRMGRLIDDLLSFSRTGRQEMAWQSVDMNALARSVADELLGLELQGRIELTCLPLHSAWGDAPLLRQVWVNLIGNAIKFTRRRQMAHIEIGSRMENGEVIYWVKDDGAGFDMQYAGKLFGVFQRLHRQDEFEGTGVGLAISERIVHRHHGRIWGEGKPDAGATFSFALPQAASDHPHSGDQTP